MAGALAQGDPRERIIIALDDMTWEEAGALLEEVGPHVGMAKANAMADRPGWDFAVAVADQYGMGLMADGKYHDTDRTMESHLNEATLSGAQLITAHAANKPEALVAAIRGRNAGRAILAESANGELDPGIGRILGITVLTSYDDDDSRLEFGMPVLEKVMQLARRAARVGLDGVVCSVHELDALEATEATRGLLKVTPGIILPGKQAGSGQKRVATAGEAINRGADFIVVGSAITQAPSPAEAAQQILQDVTDALRR